MLLRNIPREKTFFLVKKKKKKKRYEICFIIIIIFIINVAFNYEMCGRNQIIFTYVWFSEKVSRLYIISVYICVLLK